MWLRTHCKKPNLPFFSPGFGEYAVAMASIQCLLVRLVEPTAQPHVKVTRHLFSSQFKYHSNASSFHNSPSPAVTGRWALLLCKDLVGCHSTGTGETQHRFHLSSMCHAIQLSQAVIHLAQTLTTVWDCMWVTSEANDMSISNSNLTSDSLFVRQMANGKAFIPSNNNKILHLKFGQHMSCTKRLKHNVTCLKMIHHTKKLDDCHT